MHWSLSSDELTGYVVSQLSIFANSAAPYRAAQLTPYMQTTLDRVERCFSSIRRKYFFDGEKTIFNHHHGDHYAMFLYYLSNTVHIEGGSQDLAASLFLMNKMLHGVDMFYSVSLPEIFLLIHPVGTVLGNASYKDYFVAYQNCGVGSLENGIYPTFDGENVLFARSAVLGGCHIGRNVVLGANAFLLNVEVPDNSVVVGAYPAHRILENKQPVIERMFR